ncbi:MAG: hypothetical protein H0X02_01420 [Nitrosomonas sp.]|nr:hypothetical protein [Nitrosomonas sp.]
MDTLPKLKHLVFFLLLFPSIAFAQAAPTGYVDLAGWVKGVDGSYSKAFDGSTRTSPLAGTLKAIGDTTVHTSKGAFTISVEKTATVDLSRIGSAVAKLAKVAGPLGIAATAASLVCELTTICNQAGQWMLGADPALEGYPSTTPVYRWGGYGGLYPNPQTACDASVKAHYNGAYSANPIPYQGQDNYYDCQFKDQIGNPIGGYAPRSSGCADNYVLNGSQCVLQGNSQPRSPTTSDWDSKLSLLNDSRFIPELIDKLADIPTGVPTITNTPKKVISEDTAVTKDQNGNATGTKVTTTEAEIVDAASAESPGQAIVKEKTTVTNYDINNTVINSTTSTSYSSQPPPDKPADPLTISFDEVEDTGIEQQDVDADLEAPESWGDGFCPADETIDYHYGTLTFDFQPTCDFATDVRPVLIFIASITALFIIAGVKTE